MRHEGHPVYGQGRLYTHKGTGTPSWIYHLDRDRYPARLKPISPTGYPSEPTATQLNPVCDWTKDARRYAVRFNRREDVRAELAEKLRLPAWCLASVELIGTNGANSSGSSFTLPERDGQERIIGLSVRRPPKRDRLGQLDSGKEFVTGGHRGLTIPAGWRDVAGPLLIVEGASDVLACAAAGLAAIGRPSNVGGSVYLAELLRTVPATREIVVVGEGDRKPDTGEWPGRWGAYWNAIKLARELNRSIGWAMVRRDDGKDARGYLTRKAKADDSRRAWEDAGQDLLAALRSDLHFSMPRMLLFSEPIFQGGRPPCGATVGLVGKEGGNKSGQNGVVHRPCKNWACGYCRAWRTDQCATWLYRVIGEWCDPDRLPDGVPLIADNLGRPIDGMQIPRTVHPPKSGNPGPWRMYSTVIAATDWPALKQKMKRIEAKHPGGIEFCRIEFDPSAYPNRYRPETDSLILKAYSDLGTRSPILCLIALAPEAEPVSGFQAVTTDDAIRMSGEALASLPNTPTGGKKYLRPVNFSDGWAMMEPLPSRGEWERDCVPLHQPDAVRDILERLGVSVDQPNIGTPATTSRWHVTALGGNLKAWIFRQLICTRQPGSRKPLGEDDIVRLFPTWAKFVDDARPPIQLGTFVRHTIGELLHAEPLPIDIEAIRSAERHDQEFGATMDGDFDFWPATSASKTGDESTTAF